MTATQPGPDSDAPRSSRRPPAAALAALRAYRGLGLATRAHVVVRWWTAPLAPVAAALPVTGPLLEIGCGHGLFSLYAALAAPGRTVQGIDIDHAKIDVARRAAVAVPRADARFAAVSPGGALPPGPWPAIAVVDVLYLLPVPDQRRLLREAAVALAPGGTLVVKEMSDRPRWKAAANRLQETVSVRLLRITEGSDLAFVAPDTMAGWLRDAGLTVSERRLDRRRIHPHHLLVARRPG